MRPMAISPNMLMRPFGFCQRGKNDGRRAEKGLAHVDHDGDFHVIESPRANLAPVVPTETAIRELTERRSSTDLSSTMPRMSTSASVFPMPIPPSSTSAFVAVEGTTKEIGVESVQIGIPASVFPEESLVTYILLLSVLPVFQGSTIGLPSHVEELNICAKVAVGPVLHIEGERRG